MRRTAWLALAMLAAPAWADEPSPSSSLLAELFPNGLPVSFAALIDALRREAGAANVQTALVPLGRSLQRYAADPDYFTSPRVVVAVTGDGAAGPDAPRLADRLFLGYQPAAEVVEAISYDEDAGRFAFEEVVGYGAPGAAIEAADARICQPCHQGHGPIFARPLWSETNANPAIVASLVSLGGSFQGAPVRQTVDALAAFDAATHRAAETEAANLLWAEGCGDAACRARLLNAAVQVALGGTGWLAAESPTAHPTEWRAASLWPEGVALASPDIPNRDPFLQDNPTDLENPGLLDPATPRALRVLWQPEEGFAGAVRLVAAQFTTGDRDWIATRAVGSTLPKAISLRCEVGGARFDCVGQSVAVTGLTVPGEAPGIRRLAIDGLPPFGRLLGDRLPDGRRADLELAGDRGTLTLHDDLGQLGAALAARAEAGAPALGNGPFRRRAVLALIGDCLESANG